jgi:hypothetical protein
MKDRSFAVSCMLLLDGSARTTFMYFIMQLSHTDANLTHRHQTQNRLVAV